jgi:hypothetical protein
MNKRCPTVSERDGLLSDMNERRVALGLAKISQDNFIKYIIRYQSSHLFIYFIYSVHSSSTDNRTYQYML